MTKTVLVKFTVDNSTTDVEFVDTIRKLYPTIPIHLVTNGQVISSAYHKPVCTKCGIELRPEINGVGLLDLASFGPYALYDADLWECPTCHIQVVGGFAHGPHTQHFESSFESAIEQYRKAGKLIECKEH
jgi:hypothetical protein